MKPIILILVASISLALITGCRSGPEQVQHSQESQQKTLMKQMEKEQSHAEKLSQ